MHHHFSLSLKGIENIIINPKQISQIIYFCVVAVLLCTLELTLGNLHALMLNLVRNFGLNNCLTGLRQQLPSVHVVASSTLVNRIVFYQKKTSLNYFVRLL